MARSLERSLDQLSQLEESYRVSCNPILAWQGYEICRQDDIPLQRWILDYFDAGARSICTLVDPTAARFRLPHQARQVGYALGFGIRAGQANLFEQAKRSDRNQNICAEIKRLISQRRKLYLAYEDASKTFGLSPSTICRIWLASRRSQPGKC